MASRQESGPPGQNLGLEARIWALRLGFRPQDWDLGLETGIWTSTLGFKGEGMEKEVEAKKKEERIPHMYESIGHQPLQGHCLQLHAQPI